MVKLIAMLRRKPGLSPEEFRHLYEERHSRIGMNMFGHLWKEYRRNYLTTANSFAAAAGAALDGDASDSDSPYDVVTEFVFEDLAALEEQNRIATLPENKKILSEDEETLFDRERSLVCVCEVLVEDLAGIKAGKKVPVAPVPAGEG